MDTAIVVALVAAAVSLVTSGTSLYRQQRMAVQQRQADAELVRLGHELEEQVEAQRRERDAADQLNLYREPLLDAAKDLFYRVRNIRERGFLGYVETPDAERSRIALLGTFYRLGKFWGTVDSLYGTVSLLQFERNDETKDVAGLLAEIDNTFSSDGRDVGGTTLMVWREEFRAVAELMQRGAPAGRPVIGVATFVERYDTDFGRWFKGWENALRDSGIEVSPRLTRLQQLSGRLVTRLEEGRT